MQGRAWRAVHNRARLVPFRTDKEACMIRVRSAFLMVSGVALLLAIVVTTSAALPSGVTGTNGQPVH